MLARTRIDVDALNTRARTAAVARGQVHGPVVTAGEREWQAGDLLRTRRNNRQLALGDSHVRNGDRFRVLGVGPSTASGTGGTKGEGGQGLIVGDLAGRGRTILPAEYLAKHCEYGWASTIDSAQGATADVGLVLVRPGMDREHLYVAMTRGRLGNHAYLTPDPALDDEHDHGSGRRPGGHGCASADGTTRSPEPALEQQALRVLEAALATSGSQDAAHTALQHARTQAGQATRRAQQQERDAAELARARAQAAAGRVLPEHRAASEQLGQLQTQRGRLGQEQTQRRWRLPSAQAELDRTPRRAIRRRRDLTGRVTLMQEALSMTDHALAGLDRQISELTRQVRGYERDRQARAEQLRWPQPAPTVTDPLGYLAPPRRAAHPMPTPAWLAAPSRPRMTARDVPYRAPEREGPSRGR